MGISAIGIILCHSVVEGVEMNPILSYVLALGNVGVDIFLFLSGIGMYYSLSKSQEGVMKWYKRRFTRILLPYLIITLPWWIYYSITRDVGVVGFLLNVSTLNYWVVHMGAWYVALLIPLYLLTPIIASIINYSGRKYLVATIICIMIFVLTDNIEFQFDNQIAMAVCINIQKAFSRVPIYIVGYVVAPLVKQSYKINIIWIPMFFLVQIALPYLPIICEWQRYFIMAFPFTMLICLFMEYCCHSKFIDLFRLIGVISLESYLSNVFISYFLKEIPCLTNNCGYFSGNYIYYALVVTLGFIYAIIAYRLNNLLVK